MNSLNELKNASLKEKLAIGVSALFFLYLVGVASYVGTTSVWMALTVGTVGLVIAFLPAGIICSNGGADWRNE